MASRGRRRPRVHDLESDDEDVQRLNELNNSAPNRSQHILLSDDEDDSFTPPVPHPPQQMPVEWQPVVDVLHGRGVKPRTEWLLSCLNQLAALQTGFAQMLAARKAELCFEQILMADFNVAGAASLPPSMHTIHAAELPGPFVLQVDEVIDISNSSRDRYQEKAAGPGRMLKVSMTDGVQRVFGMEYRPIRALQVLSPAGFKVSLRNVCIRRGFLILVPEILEVLGGVVDYLEAARLRAVETINKPPRGRRVPQGVNEPSLPSRATRAAWPDETGEDSPMNPPTGSRTSTGIATRRTTTSLRVGDVEQREQQHSISQDQVADMRMPSAQFTPICSSLRVETESPAPEGEIVQPNQRAANREAASVSVAYQSTTRMDLVQQVQQRYPLEQDQNSLSSRPSGRGSSTPRPAKVEVMQDEHHNSPQEQRGGESSWQPGNVSIIHQSSRVESVELGEQQQRGPHEREVESTRQSIMISHAVTHPIEGSTPVSSQSPGAPLLSPSFGKLSLRSRRSTQASVPQQPNLQLSQPSELSTGDDYEKPIEIIESQESEQGTCTESRSSTETENIPFTYLTTLEDVRKAHTGQDVEVRGRVKVLSLLFLISCVIAGVGKFQYKGCDEFKLFLHIEDGTLITECSVAHQVVQDLIGHCPLEVSSKLADSDTHQEMLQKMILFQKLLERFEGYMDLEFRNSSPVPLVVNIVEGVECKDAKCLLRRLELSVAKQVPAGVQ